MANVLKVALQQAFVALRRRGSSFRRIAEELGAHPETVSRYVRLADRAAKPYKVTAGNLATRSQCEPFRAPIVQKLAGGLSAQRIYQDLVAEHGFSAGYECVRWSARRLR